MKKTAIILTLLAIFAQSCKTTTPEYVRKNISDTKQCIITVDGRTIELSLHNCPEEKTEKEIIRLYWINAETGEEIETISRNQKARLVFETQGYAKGEKIEASVERGNGGKFEDNSTELIYWGIVDENGKAISEQVFIYNSYNFESDDE